MTEVQVEPVSDRRDSAFSVWFLLTLVTFPAAAVLLATRSFGTDWGSLRSLLMTAPAANLAMALVGAAAYRWFVDARGERGGWMWFPAVLGAMCVVAVMAVS